MYVFVFHVIYIYICMYACMYAGMLPSQEKPINNFNVHSRNCMFSVGEFEKF